VNARQGRLHSIRQVERKEMRLLEPKKCAPAPLPKYADGVERAVGEKRGESFRATRGEKKARGSAKRKAAETARKAKTSTMPGDGASSGQEESGGGACRELRSPAD